MKFKIRFQIGKRLGKGSTYSLKEFCVSVIGTYSLTEAEVCAVVGLQVGEKFTNADLEIVRLR